MIREFEEECGLRLKTEELETVGMMYPKCDDFDYINLIYKADLTDKKIVNQEPHKCGSLTFHPIESLPEAMDPYIKKIIEKSFEGKVWICENGF